LKRRRPLWSAECYTLVASHRYYLANQTAPVKCHLCGHQRQVHRITTDGRRCKPAFIPCFTPVFHRLYARLWTLSIQRNVQPHAIILTNTVGSRAYPVAASLIWNSLPDDVISAESLPTFQRKLKRHLFCQSFAGFCYWHLHLQWTLPWQCHLGHSKNTLIDWLIETVLRNILFSRAARRTLHVSATNNENRCLISFYPVAAKDSDISRITGILAVSEPDFSVIMLTKTFKLNAVFIAIYSYS